MSKLMAFYGTLRKGYGNHKHLVQNIGEYVGTTKTSPNYTMYNLGYFPAVSQEGNTPITVEVYKFNDEEDIQRVNSLEGFISKGNKHNFYDCIEIDTEYGKCDMFVLEGNENHQIIKSGDWNQR